MIRLFLQGVLAVAIIAAGLVVGEQLRASRERFGTGQAGSAASVQPTTTVPTAMATMQVTVPPQQAAPAPAARTIVPTPFNTPYTGAKILVSGTVTMGGAPVRGAQVMVYPSDSSNHGPTPVPPESGMAITDSRGAYQVQLPPGTYRVGAYRDYNNPVRDFGDGYTWVTWYGDGFVIGLGKDLVVSGASTVADISMLRSVKIAGRVVGKDSVGVPGAQLSLSRDIGGIQFPFGAGTTDAAGRFSLSHVAMAVTLHVLIPGNIVPSFTTIDLDLRADRTDLVVTLDRGNIVTGTLRDAAGRRLAETNFGVIPTDPQVDCGWCNGRSDASGHFAISLPTTMVRFRNWPMNAGDPDLLSQEYVISGDQTLDPLLGGPPIAPPAAPTAVPTPVSSPRPVPSPVPTQSPTPWPSPAAGRAALFGRVVDASGSPLVGATVTIRPSGVSALTSALGSYELPAVDVGSARCVWMTVEIRVVGYGSLTTIDNPINAGAYQGDFQLRPGDRRQYIGLPLASANSYLDPSQYCTAGDWIAPGPGDSSN